MYLTLLWALVGCVAQPAAIKLDGEPVVTVNQLVDVPLPASSVVDAKDVAIEPQPVVTWTVTPPEVASIAPGTTMVTPLAEGSAQITAKVNNVEASFTLNVRLPDTVEVGGVVTGQQVPAGQNVPVTAKVMDGENVMEGMSVIWASSNPDIAAIEGDQFVARMPGEVTITASAGAQSNSVTVTVIEAAPVDPAAAPTNG